MCVSVLYFCINGLHERNHEYVYVKESEVVSLRSSE